MANKVLIGDVRSAHGCDWIVLGRKDRGRSVVVGVETEQGVAYTRETRDRRTVASWPKCGRVRVSARDGGGHYIAPWKGRLPRLVAAR